MEVGNIEQVEEVKCDKSESLYGAACVIYFIIQVQIGSYSRFCKPSKLMKSYTIADKIPHRTYSENKRRAIAISQPTLGFAKSGGKISAMSRAGFGSRTDAVNLSDHHTNALLPTQETTNLPTTMGSVSAERSRNEPEILRYVWLSSTEQGEGSRQFYLQHIQDLQLHCK
ncbi:hypothetical protein Leryth_018636 [Lithospermum erythrorhizon]|nr:hypothetical protein Leryth_018636 [Lithospermum erythrorhizon]